MTTPDGANAEAKVEAMTDERLARFRRLIEHKLWGVTYGDMGQLLARLDAEAARAKAAEAEAKAVKQMFDNRSRALEKAEKERDDLRLAMGRILDMADDSLPRTPQSQAVKSIAAKALNVKGG